jgi:hypothetical protein
MCREGKAVIQTPKERLAGLRRKIEQQKLTVASLKREGHVYADPERQLHIMLAELQESERLQKLRQDN